jgi:Tfp pilus assembly protein PilF
MTILHRKELIISLVLILVTYTLYAQIIKHDFVNIDDHVYVTENLPVQRGLTLQGTQWAFTTLKAEFWHPLTWLSLMLDTQLYGVISGGYLFTNLLLHLFNTLILFNVLNRATKNYWQSGFVAILFAVHPLHVESVAWISQRKDLLSALFWLLALWCYGNYVQKTSIWRYMGVSVLFILGLMSKSMVVTLPLVLLLMDYWPYQRFAQLPNQKYRPYVYLIAEKLPWFMLSMAVGILTIMAQRSGEGLVSLDIFAMNERILNALISYTVYIYRMFWPLKLAVFYPFPTSFSIWKISGETALLVLISLFAIRLRNRFPFLLMGWLWYLLTLFPVIGILKIGAFANADRYTYLPLIGLFIGIVWTIPELVNNNIARRVGLAICAAIIIGMIIISNAQIKHWSNGRALFEHALESTEANYFAHFSLGNILATEQDFGRAAFHFKQADQFYPQNVLIKNSLARVLALNNEFKAAQDQLEKAIVIRPEHGEAHYHLGLVLIAQLRYREAIEQITKALIHSRTYQELSNQVSINSPVHRLFADGVRLEKTGKLEGSMDAYQRALSIQPRHYPSLIRLSKIYIAQKANEEALALFKISTSPLWLRDAWLKGYTQWELIKR